MMVNAALRILRATRPLQVQRWIRPTVITRELSILASPSATRTRTLSPFSNATIYTTRRFASKAQEITLPALSPSMEEGKIVQWMKKEGDSIKAGEVLFTLQTDKATLDVEASEDGVLAKILVHDGESRQVNDLVAYVVEKGTDISKLDLSDKKPAKKPEQPAKPAQENQTKPSTEKKPSQPEPQKAASDKKPAEKPVSAAPPKQEKSEPSHSSHGGAGRSTFLFPSVRRLLAEHNLELSQITPTGPLGRVVKGDVLAAVRNGIKPSGKSQSATSSSTASSSTKPDAKTAAAKPPTPAQQPSADSYTDIPNNNIRMVIAKRLTQSKTTVPHSYYSAETNIQKLMALRARLNEAQPVKLSVNDFIMKAAALALKDVPRVNASWVNDSIQENKTIDVSVAVATDKGLITPIIKNTNAKGLGTISSELKELAKRAREGKLKPEEFQGGTFSVSNLGMFGISNFVAVINPPQSCIMAVGGSRKKVVPAQTAIEEVYGAKRKLQTIEVMDVTLSCDSRVIDEEVAGKFLEKFQEYISNPERMLL